MENKGKIERKVIVTSSIKKTVTVFFTVSRYATTDDAHAETND